MMKLSILIVWLLIVCSVHLNYGKVCTRKCPSGCKIYAWGTNSTDHRTIVSVHNKFRIMILNGLVKGQPRAKSMNMLMYDKNLDRLSTNVTRTCVMNHVIVKDKRWQFVGQNLYMERSSKKVSGANWEKAITKWFNEYKLYKYPNQSDKRTGHYTQVVAQNTSMIGCDYIFFYDSKKPKTPYSKLYACNYGPTGNIVGIPPYKRA